MKKRAAYFLLTVIFIISLLSGCGSAKTSGTAADYSASEQGKYDGSYRNSNGGADVSNSLVEKDSATQTGSTGANKPDSLAISGGSGSTANTANIILSERKVIRSANVTIEVQNFDEAYGKIDSLIQGIGFVQSTNIDTEKVYSENKLKLIKRGSIVIRVDKDRFDKTLNNIKGIGDVYNWSINGEDVTDKYFDVESRLKLLRLEENRVMEYLKKLSDINQIYITESRLTTIRQEIEGLTGNLKKMSDLVDLSTININMNEKYPDSANPDKPKAYGQRLLSNLLDSLKGVVNFCGELIIILVAAIPVLVLLGIIVLLVLFVYKRVSKKKPKNTKNEEISTKDKDEDINTKDKE